MHSTTAPRSSHSVGITLLVLPAVFLLSVSDVWAAGDATAGRALFSSRCAGCHSASPGVNKIGPSLAGIVGSKSGTVPGYNFSVGMKNVKITWDGVLLDKFLQNPNGVVHGTKMFYSVSNPTDRQNLIAYLGTLKP
jgi:cytochrome c